MNTLVHKKVNDHAHYHSPGGKGNPKGFHLKGFGNGMSGKEDSPQNHAKRKQNHKDCHHFHRFSGEVDRFVQFIPSRQSFMCKIFHYLSASNTASCILPEAITPL